MYKELVHLVFDCTMVKLGKGNKGAGWDAALLLISHSITLQLSRATNQCTVLNSKKSIKYKSELGRRWVLGKKNLTGMSLHQQIKEFFQCIKNKVRQVEKLTFYLVKFSEVSCHDSEVGRWLPHILDSLHKKAIDYLKHKQTEPQWKLINNMFTAIYIYILMSSNLVFVYRNKSNNQNFVKDAPNQEE